MVELSANMSWLDPLDRHDLNAFEPVNDAGRDIDSVERIAQVEAMAAALFKPFFDTGLKGFDSCPRDSSGGTSNCLLRIHCARSVDDYADYNRNPEEPSYVKSQPSKEEEWEHLLTSTPTARRHIQRTPSTSHKVKSAFKPYPPRQPPTPRSHSKAEQNASYSPLQSGLSIKQEQYAPANRQTQAVASAVASKSMPAAGHSRAATPESDTDSGEEDTGDESQGPKRGLLKQLSSSTVVNSDTQLSSGAPSRDVAIADLIRDIAEDSQEIRT